MLFAQPLNIEMGLELNRIVPFRVRTTTTRTYSSVGHVEARCLTRDLPRNNRRFPAPFYFCLFIYMPKWRNKPGPI